MQTSADEGSTPTDLSLIVKHPRLREASRTRARVLRVIGEELEGNGTSKMSSREIDRIIQAFRSRKPKW